MRDFRISSAQNPKIKAAALLTKHRERERTGLFLIEGAREIERALASGFEVTQAFHCPEAASPEGFGLVGELRSRLSVAMIAELGLDAFAKLAMREGSDGIVVVARQKKLSLDLLSLPQSPLILAVEALEKPGNLGALLRTADGAGADAVVILDETIDIYNPNVVRASLGTLFKLQVVSARAEAFRDLCKRRGIKVHAAALSDRSGDYAASDYRGPSAILLGSEAHGLSQFWMERADELVKIPMLGIADSLNVAAAGAVLLYEARRQRR